MHLILSVSSHTSISISIGSLYFTDLSTGNVAACKKGKLEYCPEYLSDFTFFRKVKICCVLINCPRRMFLNKS